MITVTVGNNLQRIPVVVSPDTTIRQILEENEMDYSRTAFHLDGASLQSGDLDKTLAQLGITTKCFLISVAKADSAR